MIQMPPYIKIVELYRHLARGNCYKMTLGRQYIDWIAVKMAFALCLRHKIWLGTSLSAYIIGVAAYAYPT